MEDATRALSENPQLVLSVVGVVMAYVGGSSGRLGIGLLGIFLTLMGVGMLFAVKGPGAGIF